MRIIFFVILMFGCIPITNAQDIVVRTFVKEDTVLLRWAPTNFDDLILGLKHGYEVLVSDGANERKLIVEPFRERIKSDDKDSSEYLRNLSSVVESVLDNPSEYAEKSDMLYALWMLSAGPDKEIAKLFGLYLQDLPKKNTSYRISITGSDKTSRIVKVNPTVVNQDGEMSELHGVSKNKLTEVYLDWEAVAIGGDYSGFNVERSEDSIHFETINERPLIFFKSQDEADKTKMDFVDTLVKEGETYYYRIQGINHFGDKGKTSNIVPVYITRSLFGVCRIDTVFSDGFDRKIPGKFLFHNDSDIGNLKEFVLYRSDSMYFGYEEISKTLPDKNTFEFTFRSELLTGDRNYFKVAAISQDGDSTWSFPYYYFTLDQEPPSKPLELEGTINDSGIVSLHWHNNPENDIRGYRVFRTNSLKEEFIEVTTDFVLDSIFKDTISLDNLTSEIYYKISAVDLNYNNSEYSDWVLLLKPDTIPPVPCVFKDYKVMKEGVHLVWVNSTSKDAEANYLLRTSNNVEYDTICYWMKDSLSQTTDSTMTEQDQYQYYILTQDEQENQAISQQLTIQYELGYRSSDHQLTAEVDRENKIIHLNWKIDPKETYNIQVYRKKNEDGFKLVRTIHQNIAEGYSDKNLSINNTYRYKIKVMYNSGISSKMSDAIVVEY